MGFMGFCFTWSNRQGGGDLIQERIDRGLCCMGWSELFPNAIVEHLDFTRSDHKPILISGICRRPRDRKSTKWGSRFHFEDAWAHEEDCKGVIERAWHGSQGLFLNISDKRFGLGMIVRNSRGKPCLAAAISSYGVMDVEIAEAKALVEGIKLVSAFGLHLLVIESDASNVVSLCNNFLFSRGEIGSVVQDINWLCYGYDLGPISFIPCCCNNVAHSFVKIALSGV
ncbi:hypothetical protein ACOSP7_008079 [Xanthoceras sorbifolium]